MSEINNGMETGKNMEGIGESARKILWRERNGRERTRERGERRSEVETQV